MKRHHWFTITLPPCHRRQTNSSLISIFLIEWNLHLVSRLNLVLKMQLHPRVPTRHKELWELADYYGFPSSWNLPLCPSYHEVKKAELDRVARGVLSQWNWYPYGCSAHLFAFDLDSHNPTDYWRIRCVMMLCACMGRGICIVRGARPMPLTRYQILSPVSVNVFIVCN